MLVQRRGVLPERGLAWLSDLAITVRAIVARDARDEVNSYKYVCPRVARSLDRLEVARYIGRHGTKRVA
jgi:hypothetical protein